MTSQISPPVARAVGVLNFLAEHAEQAFTLSEIAKSLRMSSATCHNLLTALAETGYIYRTAGKTYVLGPALARVAQASMAPALVMQVARPEMRLLADEFDVVCSASHLLGDEIIVRERASAVSHLNWHNHPLHKLPAIFPFAGFYLSWNEPALARWLEAATAPEEDKKRFTDSLGFLREHGFTFGVRKVPFADRKQARELQNQAEITEYGVAGVREGETYPLAYVAAPVFSRPGVVGFILSLTGFDAPAPGERILAMGVRLRGACDRIGAFIAGRELG